MLRATWGPKPPSSVGAGPLEGGTLWVSPVARAEVHLIRPLVLRLVLPDARAWFEDALASGNAWQGTRHARTWYVVDGQVAHRDRDGVETLRDRD